MKVLFLEAKEERSSPLKTLSHALQSSGSQCRHLYLNKASTKQLLKAYLWCDNIIVQFYSYISLYDVFRLSLASLFFKPIIRNWSGTDALNTYTRDNCTKMSKQLDRIVSQNFTTTHKGTVQELASVGIDCQLLPQVINSPVIYTKCADTFEASGVVAYLPSERSEFYGSKIVEQLIQTYPNLTFHIIADHEHSLAHYPNVKSWGWVSDMEEVWNSVGLVIRVTEHDGYPRMLIEALARGKYVIHNNELPGVWYANDIKTCTEQLDKYINNGQFNHAGVELYRQYIASNPQKSLFNFLTQINTKKSALFNGIKTMFSYKLKLPLH